jgi:hypothetical protein
MLVSKKLPGIRLVPVELEVVGKSPAESAKTLQQFLARRLASYAELPRPGDIDLDLVTLLEAERFDHGSGKANGETVSPLGDLHGELHRWIYIDLKVYPDGSKIKIERHELAAAA